MGIKGIHTNLSQKVRVETFRKWLLLSLVAIWSLAIYFHLSTLFNPAVISMEMTGIIPASKVESVIKGVRIEDLFLHYEKPMGEGRLIMTTGGEAIVEDVAMVTGRLLMTGEESGAVIGDQVAISEFNTLQVLGREIKVGDAWYRVVGVMDDSWDWMVSYEEEQLYDGWHTMMVRYLPPDGKRQDIVVRDVERAMALNGLYYQRKLHYSNMMNFHVNVAVLSVLTMFYHAVVWLYRSFRTQVVIVWNLWINRRNTTHGWQFISSERRLHWFVCQSCLAITGMALMGYWLIRQLRLPDEFLPDNLFSPSSWGVKIGSLLNHWDSLIENGIRGIYKTAIYSWLLLVTIALIVLIKWAMQKETVKRGGTCETSSGTHDYEDKDMESAADAGTNHRGCL